MRQVVTYFLIGLATSVALTPLCRMLAHRAGYVAKPKDDRWHRRPTALLGGLAIVLATFAVGVTIQPRSDLWPLMGCAALIAAVGFCDDVFSLKPSTKLVAQVAVGSLLLFGGYRLHWTQSMIGDAMLTLFWIVGVTNAFNLLDNMDGACAGITLIAGAFLLVGSMPNGIGPRELYLAGLLGATAGFLVYNVHPASIFLGDAGSLFLGLNLAALTLTTTSAASGTAGPLAVVAVPVLLLLIPIFDTTLVTALRLLSTRKPSQGGRDHTSHRLVAVGLSERMAVAVLWALAAAGGGISVLLKRDPTWAMIVALMFALAMIIFFVYLARICVYGGDDLALLHNGAVTPLVTDFMYKRRVAEVLLDVCLIPLAYYSAYRLRFEGASFTTNYPQFIESVPIVLALQLLAVFVVGGYRGTWRYFGMMDAVVFAKAVVAGTIGAQLVILYAYRFESYSRSVFVIYAALLMLLLAGTRASFRLVSEFVNRRRSVGRRCVIYGTAGASLATVREAFAGTELVKIVGFIDDDPRQRNASVGGYPVLGPFESLVGLVNRNEVDCVVMNTGLVDVGLLQQLEAMCRLHEVDLLRLRVDLEAFSAVS